LTGFESISISGIAAGIAPRQSAHVSAAREDGSRFDFETIVRIDAPAEVEYFRNGGILPMVLRQLLVGIG
jgi:aconitate hydratase